MIASTAVCQAPLSFTISQSCSNYCPLSWWYYLIILSSIAPLSCCLQSVSASESFPNSQLFTLHIRWPKYWSFITLVWEYFLLEYFEAITSLLYWHILTKYAVNSFFYFLSMRCIRVFFVDFCISWGSFLLLLVS